MSNGTVVVRLTHSALLTRTEWEAMQTCLVVIYFFSKAEDEAMEKTHTHTTFTREGAEFLTQQLTQSLCTFS